MARSFGGNFKIRRLAAPRRAARPCAAAANNKKKGMRRPAMGGPTETGPEPVSGRLPAAVAVWIATAVLQREAGPDAVFSNREIIAKVDELGFCPNVSRNALAAAVSVHAVATVPASPGMHRFQHRAGRAQYRLYRPGDPFDKPRKSGLSSPATYIVPPPFKSLMPWYVNEYCAQAGPGGP